MKIETYSIEELAEKGWKYSEANNYFYIGNSRFPTQRIAGSLIDILGQSFELHSIDDNRMYIETIGDECFRIPTILVKTKLPKSKKTKLIFRDEVVEFNGFNFRFPCSMRRMSQKEAIEVSKWILKVLRA